MFEIRTATENDKPAIQRHMRRFFCLDEPMCQSFGKLPEDHLLYEDVNTFVLGLTEDPSNSLVIYDRENLVAVALSEVKIRTAEFTRIVVKTEEFRHIGDILERVESESKIFEKFPEANQLLYVVMVSVDRSYRGKGLTKLLINEARNLAKAKNCDIIAADCTSCYSAAVFKQLGFDAIYTLDYNDYQVNGEPYFKVEPIHRGIEVFAGKV